MPVELIETLLKKTGWDRDKDVDLFELERGVRGREQALRASWELNRKGVNVNGGAVALGTSDRRPGADFRDAALRIAAPT